MKRSVVLALLVLVAVAILISASGLAFAEEIKLSTIVPDQTVLRSKKGAIGNGYSSPVTYPDNSIQASSLIVEGNVGIGKPIPQAKLDVVGAALLAPMAQPASPQPGMIYYDQIANAMCYYKGGANPGWITIGGEWVHSGQTVFSGKSIYSGFGISTYQELDLSAYVGARCALVFLQFQTSVGNGIFGVKPAGAGDSNYVNSAETSGPTVGRAQSALDKIFLVTETSSAGKIEWATNSATATITIVLLGYM